MSSSPSGCCADGACTPPTCMQLPEGSKCGDCVRFAFCRVFIGQPCEATNNTIEFGPLDQVSSYTYSGQECFIGNTGSYVWTYPVGLDSLFFLVVGNNMTVEGSYGTGGDEGRERPEDTANLACALPLDLSNRCD